MEEVKMETALACQILTSLAQGRDPMTGACIGTESLLNRHEVRSAIQMGRDAIMKRPQQDAQIASILAPSPICAAETKKPVPARHGEKWEPEEKRQLCAEFKAGIDFSAIAALHKRKRKAITRQLEKDGLLPPWKPPSKRLHRQIPVGVDAD
jgi:hypothetical protein